MPHTDLVVRKVTVMQPVSILIPIGIVYLISIAITGPVAILILVLRQSRSTHDAKTEKRAGHDAGAGEDTSAWDWPHAPR